MHRTYDIKVPYQDVDASRRLRLYTLENYLLNTAGRAADDSGFGIQSLLPMGWTWIITRLNLEILTLPTHGQTLNIETWVEMNAHMLSIRNFRIYMDDTLIGQAKSTWAILDLDKREIVDAFGLPMFAGSVDGDELEMARSRRIRMEDAPQIERTHVIQYSDCDYNRHCNSCKYLEIMLDTFFPLVDNCGIRLDINYVKEVHFSQPLTTCVWTDSQLVHYQQKDHFGNTSCIATISKLDKLSGS